MNPNRQQTVARQQLTRFILTGLAATATHYLILLLCIDILQLDPVIATFPAFIVAFLLGYTLNRRWTFNTDTPHQRTLPSYLALALLGLSNNALLMFIAVHLLQQSANLGFIAGLLTTPILTYLGNRHWVFKP